MKLPFFGGFLLKPFFELSFFNSLSFLGGLMKNLFSFKPFSFKGISFFELSFFFWGGFNEKSFFF
ncbi:hypothetical protein ECC14_04400 [Helicobacter pylori]|nr:hypothetical protein ECC14_04400 [Helicobacter pylori]